MSDSPAPTETPTSTEQIEVNVLTFTESTTQVHINHEIFLFMFKISFLVDRIESWKLWFPVMWIDELKVHNRDEILNLVSSLIKKSGDPKWDALDSNIVSASGFRSTFPMIVSLQTELDKVYLSMDSIEKLLRVLKKTCTEYMEAFRASQYW